MLTLSCSLRAFGAAVSAFGLCTSSGGEARGVLVAALKRSRGSVIGASGSDPKVYALVLPECTEEEKKSLKLTSCD